tara:strand:+ start:876 stop:1004 length:129 start_codon:yes stop_codon:yes gene_type:complete
MTLASTSDAETSTSVDVCRMRTVDRSSVRLRFVRRRCCCPSF